MTRVWEIKIYITSQKSGPKLKRLKKKKREREVIEKIRDLEDKSMDLVSANRTFRKREMGREETVKEGRQASEKSEVGTRVQVERREVTMEEGFQVNLGRCVGF